VKIVIIINKELPKGLVANTAAVLGISAGKLFGDMVGHDNMDADGRMHRGITTKTVPILGGTKEEIKGIRDNLYGSDYTDTTVIDFSEIAQKSLDYETYTTVLANALSSEIDYLGICIYGPVKKVNKLTGYLGLLK